MFRIWCEGDLTGKRTWLKSHGVPMELSTREEAEQEKRRCLQRARDNGYASRVRFSVEEVPRTTWLGADWGE